jgi:hypothetical protein
MLRVPAALASIFSAVAAVEAATERKDLTFLPVIRHDLHRALDHLTGCDHSGLSGKPSVADYGRVVDLVPGETHSLPKGMQVRAVTTHADGSQRVRTLEGMAKPKRAVPIEDDIAAVRAALREAEATSDGRDGLVVMLQDTLNGLLAEQSGEA